MMKNQRLNRSKDGSRIPVFYRKKRYESLCDLGDKLGLSKNQIRNALTDKYREDILEQDVTSILDEHFKGRCCYIAFGKPFYTLPEIAEHIGLHENVIYTAYRKTKNRSEFELELFKKLQTEPFKYKEVYYDSLRDFCSKMDIDYNVFWRRITTSKLSIEEALAKKIRIFSINEIHFREETFPNKRLLYKRYGFFRTIEVSFREAFPGEDPLKIFDMYLDFLEEHELPISENTQSVVPTFFYDEQYFSKASDFYNVIGITTRNLANEKKTFPYLSEETIIKNMKERKHMKTGELLFPNCTVDENAKLVPIRKPFFGKVRNSLS